MPFFSIVIPTLNEATHLPLLLRDLSRQTFTDFEVVHVDGQSEDKTLTVAAKFATKLALTSLTAAKRSVSFQRNLGATKAKSKWLIFIDADVRLPTYFLTGLHYQLAKHPTVDIFTTWMAIEGQQAISRTVNLGLEIYNQIGKAGAPGAMIGIKRQHTHTLKFDESQKILEDMLFVQAGLEKGLTFKIFREPNYSFSLRRIKKEGLLKSAGMAAAMQLKYLSGGNFTQENFGYVMNGGNYYDQVGRSPLTNLYYFMKTAPRKQLQRLKDSLTSFKTLRLW